MTITIRIRLTTLIAYNFLAERKLSHTWNACTALYYYLDGFRQATKDYLQKRMRLKFRICAKISSIFSPSQQWMKWSLRSQIDAFFADPTRLPRQKIKVGKSISNSTLLLSDIKLARSFVSLYRESKLNINQYHELLWLEDVRLPSQLFKFMFAAISLQMISSKISWMENPFLRVSVHWLDRSQESSGSMAHLPLLTNALKFDK